MATDARFVIPRLPEIGFGGDWNPEQWDPAIWDEDLRLMAEAGVNLVTVGVFSWAQLEPTPGRYEFGWLDTVLDKCAAAGVRVDLATGTASPPPWLGHRWPESLPVDEAGVRLYYGARQQYCPSSTAYRERALALADRVASRYADHDAVVMWHVGNEFGAHTAACWCDLSAEAFRDWLIARYGTIAALNEAWGTSFWSMTYQGFDQIELPNNLVEEPSPTHGVDFMRFSSDQVKSFNRTQVDIIRALSPGRPVTHNYMNQNTDFDHFAVGEDLDVASWDVYPLGGLAHGRLSDADKQRFLRVGDPDQTSFNHDLYRSVAAGSGSWSSNRVR